MEEIKKYNVPEIFGSNVFSSTVMKKYLSKDSYLEFKKVMKNNLKLSNELAKDIAVAMKNWAVERGATHYTHWFQPLNGITAEKHNSFLYPTIDGGIILDFPIDSLIIGESDASSFPSGGLRSTFEARGYTEWDYTSPAFLKEDSSGVVLCIPTVFYSPNGESLDKKKPLLNSCRALNEQTLRILKLFGDTDTKYTYPTVGVEQEYFLIDKEIYKKRKDIKLTGRTLFGKRPQKCQENNTHYLGCIPEKVGVFMREVDIELWKLGILSTTKHNEVAPCQYELACLFEGANLSSDHNQLVMETLKKVADRSGLVCLLHEKPFEYINGSGKHNNWSVAKEDGENLFTPGKTLEDNARFLLFIAAVISGADKHSDLLRATVANISNDCRLSGFEAPPNVVSIFLGEQLTETIDRIFSKKDVSKIVKEDFEILHLNKNITDRNRTSPMAFLGNRFEFRMLGSSASIAVCNTVLNTILAEELKILADKLEKSQDFYTDLYKLLGETFKKHERIIYNGNGYSEEWMKEAEKRGLQNSKYAMEAFKAFIKEESIELFVRHAIYTKEETLSRYKIKYDKYINMLKIEINTMLDVSKTQIIPACIGYSSVLIDSINSLESLNISSKTEKEILKNVRENLELLSEDMRKLEENLKILETKDDDRKIEFIKNEILTNMNNLRTYIDNLEGMVDKSIWPLPTYSDILYYDE